MYFENGTHVSIANILRESIVEYNLTLGHTRVLYNYNQIKSCLQSSQSNEFGYICKQKAS